MNLSSADFGADGDTPLSEEELQGLKVPATNKRELNLFESQNISLAHTKLFNRKRKLSLNKILTIPFAHKLHIDMFGEVWDWAGKTRKTQKNIGLEDWHLIPIEMQQALDTTKYQIDSVSRTVLSIDKIAVQFAHRLVWIHPYENGNGRWSRTFADVLLTTLGEQRFTWGKATDMEIAEIKLEYLGALKKADATTNTEALLSLARR